MAFKKKPFIKAEMVRLSPEEQEVYYCSTWYKKIALARRQQMIDSGTLQWACPDWMPPEVPTRQ